MPTAYASIPRPSTPPGLPPPESHHASSKRSFGVVCSSNINRSMEAHVVLGNAGEHHRKANGCANAVSILRNDFCSTMLTGSLFFHFVCLSSTTGLRVESYGTGTQVRLPGRTAMGKWEVLMLDIMD